MAKWIHYFTRKCLSVLLLNISVKTCNYRLYVNYVTCKHKHCWTKQTLTVRTCTFFWVWIRCRRYRSILLVWNMRIVPLGIIFVDQQSKYKTLHVNFYLALNCIHSWLLIIDCYCSFLIGLWKLYDNKWPYWFIFNIKLLYKNGQMNPLFHS